MQRFVVPQFIDAEDKIIGPITVRQFILVLAGAFVMFVLYKLLSFVFFLVVGLPFMIVIALFAFYQPNGRPFHYFFLSFLQTTRRPALRVWNKDISVADIRAMQEKPLSEEQAVQVVRKAPVSTSRLASLALLVDTGGVYREEEQGAAE